MLIDILNVIQPNINVHTSKMEGNVLTKRACPILGIFTFERAFHL